MMIKTGIKWRRGKLVEERKRRSQGLTSSEGWRVVKPMSIQRLEPLVILFKRMGSRRRMHEPIKMAHLEEEICLGLICRPTRKRMAPRSQAMNCFPNCEGARELIMSMLREKRMPRESRTGNQDLENIIDYKL